MSNGDISEREERIRQRAYELWQQAGEPSGRHDEFWHQAETEINAEDNKPSTTRTLS